MTASRSPLSRLEDLLRLVAALGLCAMALVTGSDVVGRAAGSPIFGADEIVAFLGAITVAFSLPYAHREESHIAVEIFIRNFPRAVRRLIRLLAELVMLGLYGVVAWRMADYALSMRDSGVLSMNLELPEYLVVALVGLGFVIAAARAGRTALDFLPGRGAGAQEAR